MTRLTSSQGACLLRCSEKIPPSTMCSFHVLASLVQTLSDILSHCCTSFTRQQVPLTPLSAFVLITQLLSATIHCSRPQNVSHQSCNLWRIFQMDCLAAAGLRLCPVGRGRRTYAPIPRGAHTLSTKRPWLCSVSTETHPGSPETAMSATRPGALMLRVACNRMS